VDRTGETRHAYGILVRVTLRKRISEDGEGFGKTKLRRNLGNYVLKISGSNIIVLVP
jgi:hypothetical protein